MNFAQDTLRLTALELFKLRRQRLARIVILGPALIAALVPQGFWLSAAEDMQGYLAFTTSVQLSLLVGCFLILFHSALAISWERNERTLRDTLAGPVSRPMVFFSRWLALLVELGVLVTMAAVAAYLSTLTRYSFEDIQGEAIEPLFYADELRVYTTRALLGFLPGAVALLSLGLFFSVSCAGPSIAAALSLGALLGLDVSKSIFSGKPELTTWLFNSYLPTLFDQTSYLHGVTALASGIGDVLWIDGAPRYHLQFIAPLATTAGLLIVGCVLFARKDFPE